MYVDLLHFYGPHPRAAAMSYSILRYSLSSIIEAMTLVTVREPVPLVFNRLVATNCSKMNKICFYYV
jgi:hypothetical protein